jgi:cellulose synthase/poly-beta-1,6-N-acetylglucosamine synthase-like glycosyltransferase
VTVAVLSLGLIMALGYYGKREERGQERWFNGLSTALVALLGVMLLSAFLRLQLYETAYGFTRLRAYTHFFIYWLALALIVFLALLYRRELRRFAPAAFLGSMGFAATLNLINVDGFIAQRNIQRFMSGEGFETAEGRSYPEVDISYLLTLSTDLMPTMARFADEAPPKVRNELISEIACRVNAGWSTYNRDSWQSHHFSMASAERILDDLADELGLYSVEWDEDVPGMMVAGPSGTRECRGYYGYRW